MEEKDSYRLFSRKLLFCIMISLVSIILVLSSVQNASGRYVFDFKWGTTDSAEGEFDGPQGIAIDSRGNVYIADSSNDRIQKFKHDSTFIRAWGTTGSGDGEFSAPVDVAVDSSGNVYVVDFANHRIQKFTSTGTFLRSWGTDGPGDGQFENMAGVAIDSSGNVYVSDAPRGKDRIQKFTTTGTFITKWGTEGTGDGQFRGPQGLAVDQSGNVYVTDQQNHRIQRFQLSNPCPTGTSQIEPGVCFVTKWGSFGSGAGQFNASVGLGLDSSGNVYVTDQQNHRIQMFRPDGTFVRGLGSFGLDNGQLRFPLDVAVYSPGIIFRDELVYVSDSHNDRIQVFFWEPDVHSGDGALENATQTNGTTKHNQNVSSNPQYEQK